MDRTLSSQMSVQRERLVGWFYHRVGEERDVAEDLAQETLIEAWNNRNKLIDPLGTTAWLYAIAKNILKRWERRQLRQLERFIDLDENTHIAEDTIEINLGRNEMASLLDRTLNELPVETRQIILMRYFEELSQTQVAQYLGISEGAVAVRLYRGKLELRTRLAAEERGETSSHSWQQTTMWCPGCGQHRYEGKLDAQTGELFLRCPSCSPTPSFIAWEHRETGDTDIIRGISTFKPAFNRVLNWTYKCLTSPLTEGNLRCTYCNQEVIPQLNMPDTFSRSPLDYPGMHYVCQNCQNLNYCALSGMALAIPQFQMFWKTHQRIRQLPVQYVDHQGQNTVIIAAQSVCQPTAQVAAIFVQETYQLLKVEQIGVSNV